MSTNVFCGGCILSPWASGGCSPWSQPPKNSGPLCATALRERSRSDEHQSNSGSRRQCGAPGVLRSQLWELGGSQGDIAKLSAGDIDWKTKSISYFRSKTGRAARICFDEEVEKILRALPSCGALFPYLRKVRACDRATEFKQRCRGLEIQGVTWHSCRYSWAERAREAGCPERAALGSPRPR